MAFWSSGLSCVLLSLGRPRKSQKAAIEAAGTLDAMRGFFGGLSFEMLPTAL